MYKSERERRARPRRVDLGVLVARRGSKHLTAAQCRARRLARERNASFRPEYHVAHEDEVRRLDPLA